MKIKHLLNLKWNELTRILNKVTLKRDITTLMNKKIFEKDFSLIVHEVCVIFFSYCMNMKRIPVSCEVIRDWPLSKKEWLIFTKFKVTIKVFAGIDNI